MDRKIIVKSGDSEAQTPEEIYKEIKERFVKDREEIIREFGTTNHGNSGRLEARIREHEVSLASELVRRLVEVENRKLVIAHPFHQDIDECVATSLVNGMVYLREDYFLDKEGGKEKKDAFVDYFLSNTRHDGKDRQRSLEAVRYFIMHSVYEHFRNGVIKKNYRFDMTSSLIDMVFNMYMGKGAVLGISGHHCELAHGVLPGEKGVDIRMMDPLHLVNGEKSVPLKHFASRYVHSPLGGFYFEARNRSYSPEEVLRVISKSEEVRFVGKACKSGILSTYEPPKVTIKRKS